MKLNVLVNEALRIMRNCLKQASRWRGSEESPAVFRETDAIFRLSARVPLRGDVESLQNQQQRKRNCNNNGGEKEKEKRKEEELVRPGEIRWCDVCGCDAKWGVKTEGSRSMQKEQSEGVLNYPTTITKSI